MEYEKTPVFTETDLFAFMKHKEKDGEIFPELLPTAPKFLIHVPKLDDGGGDLRFANIKAAAINYVQGQSTMEIKRVEGAPQRVATDGTGWIVINSSDEFKAIGWQSFLSSAMKKNDNKVDRKVLMSLIEYIQGFTVTYKTLPDATDTIDVITPNTNSVVNFAFDLYTIPTATKDTKYEAQPVKGYAADKVTGLFYKKAKPYKTFFVPGHFKVRYERPGVSWIQVQEYHHGAYIAANKDGSITSVDPTNMDACYGKLRDGLRFSDVKQGINRFEITTPITQSEPEGELHVPQFTLREIKAYLASQPSVGKMATG